MKVKRFLTAHESKNKIANQISVGNKKILFFVIALWNLGTKRGGTIFHPKGEESIIGHSPKLSHHQNPFDRHRFPSQLPTPNAAKNETSSTLELN